MSLGSIVISLAVVAMALAVTATVLMFVFKRPDVQLFRDRAHALAVIREPDRFLRKPYGRIVRAFAVMSWFLGAAILVLMIVAANIR